jgi:hypothetical protein
MTPDQTQVIDRAELERVLAAERQLHRRRQAMRRKAVDHG